MSDDGNNKNKENVSDKTKDFLREKKNRSDKSSDGKTGTSQDKSTDGKNFRR